MQGVIEERLSAICHGHLREIMSVTGCVNNLPESPDPAVAGTRKRTLKRVKLALSVDPVFHALL